MQKNRPATFVITLLLAVASSRNSSFGETAERADFFAGRVRLILPEVIYATPGIESNIYFDNIILTLNLANYAFDVTCPVGTQLHERWTYTPSPEEAGDYPVVIEVYDESNAVVARGKSTLRVAGAESPRPEPATLLVVGASFTEYSIYPRHILELSKRSGAARLRLIGSRGAKNMPPTDDLRHEGYSGWTAEAFAVLSGPLSRSGYHQRGATGSPFVYEAEDGSKELDFARYCAEFNRDQGPDLVTIGVGINDVFSGTDDTIDETIDRMFSHYDAFIASIRETHADTRIGVQLVTPPTTSQDGFRNYRGPGKQTRWQCRRNQHRLMERMLEHFGDRQDDHVYLVPTYLNLDTANHFPTWSPPLNAHSDKTITRVNNGTHPSEPGYRQIGDSIYCWITHMLAAAVE